MVGLLLLLSVWLPLWPELSLAGEPSAAPQVRIETGMHTARITNIALDRAGRLLASASHDKTLRLWDPADGGLLRIIRPPAGAGDEGKLYAVALSPDGGTVAAGGWTGWDWDQKASIYLFDTANGELRRRIGGLPNVIHHLAYSPDGRYLAATLGGRNGIRVYETEGFAQVAADKDYGGAGYWADFDPDGRLVTTCEDGDLRLYSSGFELLQRRPAPGGKDPFSAVFSPDGRRIAVGFYDTTAVDVLSGDGLSHLYSPDSSGVTNGNIGSVAWSADGEYLYAGGRYRDGTGNRPIRRWGRAGRGDHLDLPGADDTIMQILPLADGGLVFGAGDPALGRLGRVGNRAGKRIWLKKSAQANFRGRIEEGFLISQDGTRIGFGYEVGGKRPAQFSLAERRLGLDPPVDPALQPPRLQFEEGAEGLAVKGWENTRRPSLDGRPLRLKDYERSRSLAIAADGRHFLLGTEWRLRYYHRSGKQVWRVSVPGAVWGVNVSGDGHLGVAALGDGTIRWYRLTDGEELLALFPHADGKRWVVRTPEGFFDHSPGGERLLGYQLNRGRDRAAEFVAVERLYAHFYRPDLVARKLTESDRTRFLTELAAIGDVRKLLAASPAPEIRVLAPADGARFPTAETRLRLRLSDRGGGIGRIRVRLNGVVVAIETGVGADGILEQPLRLAPGENRLEVSAFDAGNRVESQAAVLSVHGPADPAAPATVHVLVIGVGDYGYRRLATGRLAQGAERLAAAFRGLHRQDRPVSVHELIGPVAVAAIRTTFRALAGGMAVRDSFLLYLAGRGWTMDGGHYWLPADSPSDRYAHIEEYGLDQDGLLALLAGIPATRGVLFLESYRARPARAVKGVLAEQTAWERLQQSSGRPLLAVNADFERGKDGNVLTLFFKAQIKLLNQYLLPRKQQSYNTTGKDQGSGALAAALIQALEGLEGVPEGASLADTCAQHLRAQGDDGLRIHLVTGSDGR